MRIHGTLMQCLSDYSNLHILGTQEHLYVYFEGSNESGFRFCLRPDRWFNSTFRRNKADLRRYLAQKPSHYDSTKDKHVKAFLESIVIMLILCFIELIEQNPNLVY